MIIIKIILIDDKINGLFNEVMDLINKVNDFRTRLDSDSIGDESIAIFNNVKRYRKDYLEYKDFINSFIKNECFR